MAHLTLRRRCWFTYIRHTNMFIFDSLCSKLHMASILYMFSIQRERQRNVSRNNNSARCQIRSWKYSFEMRCRHLVGNIFLVIVEKLYSACDYQVRRTLAKGVCIFVIWSANSFENHATHTPYTLGTHWHTLKQGVRETLYFISGHCWKSMP